MFFSLTLTLIIDGLESAYEKMWRDHDIVLVFFWVAHTVLRVRSLTNLLIVDGRRHGGVVRVVVVEEVEVFMRIADRGFRMNAS